MFEEGDRQGIDTDAAGQIADGVTTDAIGHDKQVPVAAPFGVIGAES